MTVAGTPAPEPAPYENTPSSPGPGLWSRWRRWRRGRPFWGGLASILSGAEILAIPLAPVKVMLEQGVAGIPSVLMGLVMIAMGLAAWFAPHYRGPAGVLTTLVAVAALPLSNLGGFLVGTILGIVGGGMTFAWQPRAAPEAPEAQEPPAAFMSGPAPPPQPGA